MINPDDDFPQDTPIPSTPIPQQDPIAPLVRSAVTRPIGGSASDQGDGWSQLRDTANSARERTEVFLRENPVPTILGALGIGLAIGLAIRFAAREHEEEKIPAGINWGFLSLPFLWPFIRSVKEKYEESSEALKDGVDRVRNLDVQRYTKPIRKRWKSWTS